jgi:hypothetical protein
MVGVDQVKSCDRGILQLQEAIEFLVPVACVQPPMTLLRACRERRTGWWLRAIRNCAPSVRAGRFQWKTSLDAVKRPDLGPLVNRPTMPSAGDTQPHLGPSLSGEGAGTPRTVRIPTEVARDSGMISPTIPI